MRDNLHNIRLRKEGDQLSNLEYVNTKAYYTPGIAQLYIFEGHGAVIKMIIKGRSAMMRHLSSSHRVVLDWLFDRINLDPRSKSNLLTPENQLADLLVAVSRVMSGVRTTTQKDPFWRCAICENYGYSLS